MKNYGQQVELDVSEAFRQTQRFLNSLGIWQAYSKTSTPIERQLSLILRTINIFLLTWVIVTNTVHMITRVTDKNTQILLLGPISFVFMNLLKFCAIYYHGNDLVECFEHMKSDWIALKHENDREIMQNGVQWAKKTTLACASLMYTGGFCYNVIMPLSVHIAQNKNNSQRMPAFPGYDVFFEAQETPTYEIVLLLYLYCVFVMYTVLICSNNLGILFVSHVNSQLEILIRFISNFENIHMKKHEKIKKLILLHTRSLRFLDLVKDILYEVCLADVIISTMLICLGEYSILQMWRNQQMISVTTYSILLLALALSPLIFCCLSEIVSEQFYNVGKHSYEMQWHKLPYHEQSSFILIILNGQSARKISAGIMDLSFVSFVSIVKTALGYFQMLRTISN